MSALDFMARGHLLATITPRARAAAAGKNWFELSAGEQDRFLRAERDTQRFRLYRAEATKTPGTVWFGAQKTIGADLAYWQQYVNKVLARKRVVARFGRRTVLVKTRRNNASACATASVIRLPMWARSEATALHELAHCLVQRACGALVTGHGWQYAETYLFLVREVLGLAAWRELRDSFKQHKIRFAAPRKRAPLTPEQRQVLVARLALYREQRAARPRTA